MIEGTLSQLGHAPPQIHMEPQQLSFEQSWVLRCIRLVFRGKLLLRYGGTA